MKIKSSIVVFLLAGTLCACKQEEIVHNKVTDIPSPTENRIEEDKEKSMIEEKDGIGTLVPIDTEHFSDAYFRKIISVEYDKNGDGVLSIYEREAVISMNLSYHDVLKGQEQLRVNNLVVDGLEYFPNLRMLYVDGAKQIIAKKHPSLRGIQVDEWKSVDFLYIKDCPQFCWMGGPYFNSYYIENAAPEVLFEHGAYGSYRYKTKLDGKLSVSLRNFSKFTEENAELFETLPVEWLQKTDEGVCIVEAYWKSFAEGQKVELYDVTVSEVEREEKENHEGAKWDVYVDSGDWDVSGLHIYADTEEKPEEVWLQIGKVNSVDYVEYSGDRRKMMRVTYDMEIVCSENGVIKLLKTIEDKECQFYWNEDGEMKMFENDWAGMEWLDEGKAATDIVSIDKEHFSCYEFRNVLEERYNLDGEEGLSKQERENICVFNFMGNVRMDGKQLDGLEYFPNLTDVYLGKVGAVVVENHPSLEVIGGETKGLKKLIIRNCPNLELVDLDLSKVEEVVIEGCEKLQ